MSCAADNCWLRTDDGWYVCQLHGVCYVSFVRAPDKANALVFPCHDIDNWRKTVSAMAGIDLTPEPCKA